MLRRNTDEHLVKKTLEGCKKSQNLLYYKYFRIISSYVKKQRKHCLDFEDIASEVIIKIFINLKKFNPKKSRFNTWVHTILINHLKDINKKNKIDHIYCDQFYNTTLSSDFLEFWNKNSGLIEFNPKGLSESDITLLELKYVYGYTYEDICFKYKSTTEKITNRVNYIKKKIKKELVE